MDRSEIARLRLHNQRIGANALEDPTEVVRWLCAVQAQDYCGSVWGLGLRMRDASQSQIERTFNRGGILRTHLLRPTWHFILPQDIRWLLALTSPRVHAINGSMYRKLELSEGIFSPGAPGLRPALERRAVRNPR